MRRYAIDVVILPPKPIMDLAITWNKRLSEIKDQSIVLDRALTLPHISLLMGCVSEDGLRKAMELLVRFTSQQSALELQITGLQFTEGSHPVAALDIKLTRSLAEFQERLIETLQPLVTHDAREIDLFDPPPISASVLEWINNFIRQQSGSQFWPHITLGHGRPDEQQPALGFMANRIGMCHLGNHCTCRKVLTEALLR